MTVVAGRRANGCVRVWLSVSPGDAFAVRARVGGPTAVLRKCTPGLLVGCSALRAIAQALDTESLSC